MTDNDIPAQTVTISLDPPVPPGAEINPSNGVFIWKPTQAQALNSYTITVRATDDGKPNQSSTRWFTVTVGQHPLAPRIGNVSVAAGGITINWIAIVGKTYRVQFKNSLSDADWNNLNSDLTADRDSMSIVDTTTDGHHERYYRVLMIE